MIDPDGDCTIDLKDGRLTIRVPGRPHGLDAEVDKLNSPRVLREIEGDFIADLKVDGAHQARRTIHESQRLAVPRHGTRALER